MHSLMFMLVAPGSGRLTYYNRAAHEDDSSYFHKLKYSKYPPQATGKSPTPPKDGEIPFE